MSNELKAQTDKNIQISDVQITGIVTNEYSQILTPEAINFLVLLSKNFENRRLILLEKRKTRQKEIMDDNLPDFLPETKKIRESAWTVAQIPVDLKNRKVEITGPVDRKMIVNALNSGANVFMADFEDSNSPTWSNNIQGQINLRDAINKTINFTNPEGKNYFLNDHTATLMVRPRGWHLTEKHFKIRKKDISASLFDFGLYFFHNAKNLIAKHSGPYFYLPKLESHEEARLWNDVFNFSQDELGIPRGTIRATVLIETILAAFEMDEILYELRDHSAGLNCGRWDYIFSFIKKFKHSPHFLLPDREQITMEKHFLNSYVLLLINTCHKRSIHAMGGMAAQIPIKSDPAANEKAFEKVRKDKEREALAGHDGTWVAHPGLVPVASEIFNKYIPGSNQIDKIDKNINIASKDLLSVPEGEITEKGLRTNINIGIQYLESWLRGTGCVPLYNLMEDAATAEISRIQVWQWIKHKAKISGGNVISLELVKNVIKEELELIKHLLGSEKFKLGKFELAARLFEKMVTEDNCPDFLTLGGYDYID